MSEQKPYQYTIKRIDGTEENISADEAAVEQTPVWVFKKDGQVVRRILKDELTRNLSRCARGRRRRLRSGIGTLLKWKRKTPDHGISVRLNNLAVGKPHLRLL